MSTDDDTAATVRAYFDAVNHERFADVAALFADDGVLVAPGAEPCRGPAAVQAHLRRVLELWPEHHDEPMRVVVAGRTATAEIRFTGRLANGEQLAFDAVDVFDVNGEGRIVRLSSWYDSHALRAAIRAARDRSTVDAR